MTVFLKSDTKNVVFLICCSENTTKIVAVLESAIEIVSLFALDSIKAYRKCSTFVCRVIECYKYCITLRNYHKSDTFCVALWKSITIFVLLFDFGIFGWREHPVLYARHKTRYFSLSSRSCAERKDNGRRAEGFYRTRVPFLFNGTKAPLCNTPRF